MSTARALVSLTAKDRRMIGKADPSTRLFRREGSAEDAAEWLEYIMRRFGPSVSPGGVNVYVPVSRAGVHKRLRSGKLTAFMFHVTHREKTFFGRDRVVKAQPYVYIPVSECKAWAAEVEERCRKQKYIAELDTKKSD
jgi:hypothetical protein